MTTAATSSLPEQHDTVPTYSPVFGILLKKGRKNIYYRKNVDEPKFIDVLVFYSSSEMSESKVSASALPSGMENTSSGSSELCSTSVTVMLVITG